MEKQDYAGANEAFRTYIHLAPVDRLNQIRAAAGAVNSRLATDAPLTECIEPRTRSWYSSVVAASCDRHSGGSQ